MIDDEKSGISRFDFYGLSEEQEKVAKDLYLEKDGLHTNYTLQEVDTDTIEIWIENTDDDEYRDFLKDVLDCGADLYTLVDNLGGFSQEIGEMAVY